MSNAKEIRSKIKGIQNTQKITRAMEMVAASKMRKAQDRMQTSRPYARLIRKVMAHIAKGHSEYRHTYLEERPASRVGYITVTTDRGLCGGLNVNLLRKVIPAIKQWQSEGHEVDLCTIGQKGLYQLTKLGCSLIGNRSHLGDMPSMHDLIGVTRVMLDAYEAGKVDRVFIAFNDFVNTMSQKPTILQLLPILPSKEKDLDYYWDYLYEPGSAEVLDTILTRYVESQVYQAVVENIASEQSARMVAMKSASENAGNLIDQFQLAYNKARQAAITQELAEICSGAAAV